MMLCFIVVAVVVTLVIHILSVIVVVKAVVKTVVVVFYCSCWCYCCSCDTILKVILTAVVFVAAALVVHILNVIVVLYCCCLCCCCCWRCSCCLKASLICSLSSCWKCMLSSLFAKYYIYYIFFPLKISYNLQLFQEVRKKMWSKFNIKRKSEKLSEIVERVLSHINNKGTESKKFHSKLYFNKRSDIIFFLFLP